ncbi:inorganic diphosphatase [Candidatus Roizmanbacteria bacterium CG22_combo_CG10-13_8_21_14_all_38_20]|uniref:Inorganic pyrophosphatase n=1 Tax=Candidatus Roizmanbacteria bacterium CG22_combo_CG10-13_8_21_14_all_38_20 TaxID=1974862 RepID=A0A2H0BUM9_9BACT|nr:inorganic diphosphatase [Candidatus Microgenomates bacterium]PIP61321.1 MAG: inorganic diphosphatase [Candidatus Roizmanbacteria bacterium CG22_combo_CG10-13_8_21_14_all_38_20]PJC30607.1 MAG: inorganic diphosphatase [Candidatus Roizmanbacteria bacterium CG_4_9_14_0_2_um_filter_38_17]
MKNIPAGKNPPKLINVYIEIPAEGDIKYEIDEDSGALFVDRFAFTAFVYPFNYGFIPNTKGEDGDALDVLVLSSKKVAPGVVIPSRPVGMLEMEDEEGIDTKILAVPVEKVDPFMAHVQDISDVTDPVKNQIRHFFEHYKELEPNKWVKLKDWKDKASAMEQIQKSLK